MMKEGEIAVRRPNLIAFSLIFVFLLSGCGQKQEQTVNTEAPNSVISEQADTSSAPLNNSNLSLDEVADTIRQSVDLETTTVYVDGNTVFINTKIDNLAYAAQRAKENNQEYLEVWNDFTSKTQETCGACYEVIEQYCPVNSHISMNILNDEDDTLVLFSSLDGSVIYDYVKE